MRQLIFLVLVLMFSNFIHAENWKLSKHIEVTPPEGLDITFQINEAYDPDEKIIMGWTGDELNYMMMADYQPGGIKPMNIGKDCYLKQRNKVTTINWL